MAVSAVGKLMTLMPTPRTLTRSMAMEIQITRRAGYAMKIKTPAEAVGHPFATNRKVAPASGLCGGWISQAGRRRHFLKPTHHRPNPARKKIFLLNPPSPQFGLKSRLYEAACFRPCAAAAPRPKLHGSTHVERLRRRLPQIQEQIRGAPRLRNGMLPRQCASHH